MVAAAVAAAMAGVASATTRRTKVATAALPVRAARPMPGPVAMAEPVVPEVAGARTAIPAIPGRPAIAATGVAALAALPVRQAGQRDTASMRQPSGGSPIPTRSMVRMVEE